ncbi:MAG: hypothetical protein AB1646_20300 [Thermodesulfobacteriota bacterium]
MLSNRLTISRAILEAQAQETQPVIPAEAGIRSSAEDLDPGFRRGDEAAD